MFLKDTLNYKECFMALLVGMVASNLGLHVIPEVFENDHASLLFIILSLAAGLLLQYGLHRFLSPSKKSGNQFLLFLHLHNITDGLVIGLAFLSSFSFGLFMALAVLLHDVIHKIIGFSFLSAQGDKTSTALLKISATFLSIVGGALLMILLKPGELLSALGSAFAAGSLLYITILLFREIFHHHHHHHHDDGACPKDNTTFKLIAFLAGALLMIGIIFLLEAISPEHLH